ncbi:MAG TPA: OsmC family protein [Caulobacteraceae bacterium]|nr:OsmC family protein [Caulobacteraceae bacterium]
MSEHRAELSWRRDTAAFDYDSFDRRHRIAFEDGRVALEGDAAADYGGQGGAGVDPEALFAASLGACHMLSFLAVAARMRIVVDAYADAAVAIVEKGADGRLAVTRVVLQPRATFAAEVDPAKLRQMHELAHRNCFVANAVKAAITVEPQFDAPA